METQGWSPIALHEELRQAGAGWADDWFLHVALLQIENLRAFTEERAKLSNADQFYVLLLDIPW